MHSVYTMGLGHSLPPVGLCGTTYFVFRMCIIESRLFTIITNPVYNNLLFSEYLYIRIKMLYNNYKPTLFGTHIQVVLKTYASYDCSHSQPGQ